MKTSFGTVLAGALGTPFLYQKILKIGLQEENTFGKTKLVYGKS